MPSKLLIPLILLALLFGAAGTGAAYAVGTASGTAAEALELEAEEGEEEESEESAEEECEEAAEEFAEGEISHEELEELCERQRQRSKPGPGGVLPEECVVRTFDSDAVANPSRNTVDLTIHYTTFEPTSATIAYGTRGVHIDTARRHLGDQGEIHLHAHVADGQLKKLAATHKLSVQVDIPSTPALCQRYYSNTARLHLR